MTQPITIGLVGHGYFAAYHAQAWQRLEGAELRALVSNDIENGLAFANGHDIRTVYESIVELSVHVAPDIVDIVTPPETHAALVRECAIAGIPLVVCQKPFCSTLKEAEALLEEIAASNTTVVVHENFRFQPWYAEIEALLQTGVLGKPYEIRFDLRPGDGQGAKAYLDRQAYFRDQPEFLIRETGVHFIDLFRHLMGEVDGVFARLSRLNPVIAGEDAAMVLFEFNNGARGLLNANRLVDHKARDTRLVMGEMTIEGSDATMTLDGDGRIQVRRHGSQEAIEHEYRFNDIDFGGDCVYRCCQHILAHKQHGAALVNEASEYLVNRRLEALVYHSHRAGRWYSVNDTPARY